MPEIIKDLVCTGCSLLCDDIIVEVEKGKIIKTHHVCARGYGRYYQVDFKYRILNPILRNANGEKEISYETALSETINLLKNALIPFFMAGLQRLLKLNKKGFSSPRNIKESLIVLRLFLWE
jgi:formylmethanofuran dehydrogenase subunit B